VEAHHLKISAVNNAGANFPGSPRPIIVKPTVENSPKELSV